MPLAPPPPGSLEAFPSVPLAGSVLHRIFRHRDGQGRFRGPRWFASADHRQLDVGGRFDLLPPAGACYLATSQVAAALETFQTTLAIPRSALRTRRVFRVIAPPGSPVAADLATPAARGYGVTGEIHTSPDRRATRSWSEALYAAGWRALHGIVRHDPAQRLRTVTLLDLAGAHEPHGAHWPGEIAALDDNELAAALAPYGVSVLDDLHRPRVVALEDTGLLGGT